MNHNHCLHDAMSNIWYIATFVTSLNLGILKIGVLPNNEKMEFWTCALIAPNPSITIGKVDPVYFIFHFFFIFKLI